MANGDLVATIPDSVDLAAYQDGATFSRRFTGDDDYDYELSFRVGIGGYVLEPDLMRLREAFGALD